MITARQMKVLRLRERFMDCFEGVWEWVVWLHGRINPASSREHRHRIIMYYGLVMPLLAIIDIFGPPETWRGFRHTYERRFRLIGKRGRRSTIKPRIPWTRLQLSEQCRSSIMVAYMEGRLK